MIKQFYLGQSRVELGFESEKKGSSPSWVKQVHGTAFSWAEDFSPLSPAPEADAVITRVAGAKIHVFTADCIPVLLAAPATAQSNAIVAAIHSGWRGTMRGIVPEVLKSWPADLKETKVFIGPAIGDCHFEVREDFIEEFSKAYPQMKDFLEDREGKLFFRLVDFLVEHQLAGIPKKNIDLSLHRCTVCSKPELPSFRRNKGTDPQIRAWIQIQR